eukprot:GHVP01046573.1.p1 GENE.GHVP01046573.1~~GHVP01046573.1.p1  ORF type:complete len:222 (+),score=33.96 GHVP01046573.1:60-668(+)
MKGLLSETQYTQNSFVCVPNLPIDSLPEESFIKKGWNCLMKEMKCNEYELQNFCRSDTTDDADIYTFVDKEYNAKFQIISFQKGNNFQRSNAKYFYGRMMNKRINLFFSLDEKNVVETYIQDQQFRKKQFNSLFSDQNKSQQRLEKKKNKKTEDYEGTMIQKKAKRNRLTTERTSQRHHKKNTSSKKEKKNFLSWFLSFFWK